MILKTLTTLSLIGLLLSVGLWGVSYLNIERRGQKYSCGVSHGAVFWMERWILNFRRDERPDDEYYSWDDVPSYFVGYYRGMRTAWMPRITSHSGFVVYIVIPLWMPTLFLSSCFFPLYLPFHRRRKRKKLGLCLKCGYDLRASREKCPECGEAIMGR